MSDQPYISIPELEALTEICNTLNRANGVVALGDIPVIDSNGEPLGKLIQESPGWVFQP